MTTETRAEHTPLPWAVEDFNKIYGTTERGREQVGAAIMTFGKERGLANAALIVRAVNSHAELLAALEEAKGEIDWLIEASKNYTLAEDNPGRWMRMCNQYDSIGAAIARARGES